MIFLEHIGSLVRKKCNKIFKIVELSRCKIDLRSTQEVAGDHN